MREWVSQLFSAPDQTVMGHFQRFADDNLGLGWVYYAIVRVVRPTTVVSIGSYRGFVPMVLAKAMADNLEGGEVTFIDPSLVDGFWRDEPAVQAHFASFGITNIRHHLKTTQDFIHTDAYRDLHDIGVLFVDGFHTQEQARFDYEAFADKLAPGAIVLFHDTARVKRSAMYGEDRAYELNVKNYTDSLKDDPELQVFDLPFGSGVTLVRRADGAAGKTTRRNGHDLAETMAAVVAAG